MLTVNKSVPRWRALAASTLAFCLMMAGCSTPEATEEAPPAVSPLPAATSPSPTVARPTSAATARNDLAKLPLRRAVDAGPLTIQVKYTSRLPTTQWQAAASKPLSITVSASNRGKRSQKIYLTKVTLNVTAYDDLGPLAAPRVLTDDTNITPGFIITSPQTYNQEFTLPATDEAALYLTIDVTYEMVLQVSKDKDGRNFSKQAATDSLVVPVSP